MLVGLLRLRRYGVGTFGLAQLLWKQVGISAGAASLPSLMHSSFPKGIIWLFIATCAEVTPVVCPVLVTTLHYSQYVAGVYLPRFERYLSPLLDLPMMNWR